MPKRPITVKEIKKAELEILKCLQQQHFTEDISSLTRSTSEGTPHVKKNSYLCRLHPVLVHGLSRIGRRLSPASISFDAKHQIILPKNDHVSKLIVEHYHHIPGHSGKEHVVSVLRERFWIVKAASAVKRMLSRCVSCWRHQIHECEQKMADPPEDHLKSTGHLLHQLVSSTLAPFKYGTDEVCSRDTKSLSLVSQFQPCILKSHTAWTRIYFCWL